MNNKSPSPSILTNQLSKNSSVIYPQFFLKSQRLLTTKEYQLVFNKFDKKIHQPNFLVFIKKNSVGHARLGMAITKKKIAKAVQRNRIKRLIRENFRKESNQLPFYDMVFIMKRPVNDLSNPQISQQIHTIFSQMINQVKKDTQNMSLADEKDS